MKAKRFILCVAAVFLAVILIYFNIQREHTFTLSSDEGTVKSERSKIAVGRSDIVCIK